MREHFHKSRYNVYHASHMQAPDLRSQWIQLISTFTVLCNCLLFANTESVSDTSENNLTSLTEQERSWLASHPVIRLAPDPEFRPVEFFDTSGTYAGIGAEYAALISKKLGFTFRIVRCANWEEVIDRMQRREVDVLNAVVKTPQREKYLQFPKPYLEIPSVIIVRNNVNDELSLDRLKGMRVVMVSGYGYVDLIRNTYPEIEIEEVSNLKAGLQKVSFGMADAFVGDLATASYYIESEKITNLKLAGECLYPNISGFAVRSDWPELCSILEKGIRLLSDEERKAIHDKWIHLGPLPGVTMREFRKIALIVLVIILLIVAGFMLWNRMLKRVVHQRTSELINEIHERRKAETALREREAHLRTLIQTIPDLVWLKDPQGNYLFCNSKFERLYGAEENEIIGKTDYDFVDEKLALFFRKKDQEAIDAGCSRLNEEEVVFADDGHREILETIKTPMFNGDRQLIGILGIARDITGRKRAELKIEAQKAFIQNAIDAQNDTFFVFDPANGKALLWNKTFEAVSGYSFDEISTLKAPESYYSPEDVKKAARYIEDVFSGISGTVEIDLICKSGQRIPTEYSASVIYDKESDSRLLIAVGRDIRDRKKAAEEKKILENRLQQAQKMESIGTLAGGIAHDFNNILGAIIGFTDLATEDAPAGSPLITHLEKITAAALRAQELVKQILAFSRQTTLKRTQVNIQTSVKEGLKMLRSFIPSTISIIENINPQTGPILADPTQVYQILINLCTNAYHAMENDGGTLTIELTSTHITTGMKETLPQVAAGEYVVLSVSDTGTGIKPEILEKIFDPYFTTRETGKGTGMGLAIIHGIIEEYDGTITVESRLGKGSTFKVFFPAVQETSGDQMKKSDTIPGGNARILFIDDEQILIEVGNKILSRFGYEVTTCSDSVKGLELFSQAPDTFDLVITDQTMPDMTGVELSKRILQIRPDIPIILCTGYSNTVDKATAKELGIKEFAFKPLTRETLGQLVYKALHETP